MNDDIQKLAACFSALQFAVVTILQTHPNKEPVAALLREKIEQYEASHLPLGISDVAIEHGSQTLKTLLASIE